MQSHRSPLPFQTGMTWTFFQSYGIVTSCLTPDRITCNLWIMATHSAFSSSLATTVITLLSFPHSAWPQPSSPQQRRVEPRLLGGQQLVAAHQSRIWFKGSTIYTCSKTVLSLVGSVWHCVQSSLTLIDHPLFAQSLTGRWTRSRALSRLGKQAKNHFEKMVIYLSVIQDNSQLVFAWYTEGIMRKTLTRTMTATVFII